jgi:acetyl esterase/lipase
VTVTEDYEYLSVLGETLFVRITRPSGPTGKLPLVAELHDGAWCTGDRTVNEPIARALAERGVIVASLDFRAPPSGSYPTAIADVNYGIRWLRAHAAALGTRPDLVGVMGTSSGGHMALLNAMKPDLEPYGPTAGDAASTAATVAYVVAVSPIVCPYQHHEYLVGLLWSLTDIGYPVDQTVEHGLRFWSSAELTREGSPMVTLERREPVELPDLFAFQSTDDQLHPSLLLDEFVSLYRECGGRVDVRFVEGGPYDALRTQPNSAVAQAAFDQIAAFIHEHTGDRELVAEVVSDQKEGLDG